jgi:hypothetical protein
MKQLYQNSIKNLSKILIPELKFGPPETDLWVVGRRRGG